MSRHLTPRILSVTLPRWGRPADAGRCSSISIAAGSLLLVLGSGCAAAAGPEGLGGSGAVDATGGDVLDEEAGDLDAGEAPELADLGGVGCVPWSRSRTIEDATPAVMFLLDKSGSMRELWDHDGDPATPAVSRWWSLRTHLERWTHEHGPELEAGVQLFPDRDAISTAARGCEVAPIPEVPLGLLDPGALDALPPADAAMYGGTPATAGFRRAIDELEPLAASRGRAVVLVTDGAANCRAGTEGSDRLNVFDDLLEREVEAARQDRGIVTYVVGIDIIDGPWTGPTVNPHEAISAVALAGGVPRPGPVPYYAVEGDGELGEALDAITGAVACGVDLELPVDEADRGQIQVELDGAGLAFVGGCDEDAGWTWADPGPIHARIELCAAACRPGALVVRRQCGP